jgi:hypothetical protein
VALPLWGRWSVPPRRQGNPHHRQPDCSTIGLISCLQPQLQLTYVFHPRCTDLVVAVSVLCRGSSWPAVGLDCPFKFRQLSSSALHLQAPQWSCVYQSADFSAALAARCAISEYFSGPLSVSPSPLIYPYLVIRIWPTTSQTSHRHYTNTQSS